MVPKSKTKKRTNESIKRELLNLLKGNDDVEEQGLNTKANNVKNFQETIALIYRYEKIIKTQNKKAIRYTGKLGELFKKFKDTENFLDNVSQSRSTIHLKILLYKFLKIYPLLKTPTLQSCYFKNNFKAIRVVCKENPTLFV